ncbi:hypothetical protein H1C71_001050, partial [Ictidomys tridecemlineatus]
GQSGRCVGQGRRCWTTHSCPKEVGVRILPETCIHQVPNELHPKKPQNFQCCSSLLPGDKSLGPGGMEGTRWALAWALSGTVPGMRCRTRCGETPARRGWPGSLCHLRLRLCGPYSAPMGLWGRAASSLSSELPRCLLGAVSLRICQQVKCMWGAHCQHSVLSGPQMGSAYWGRVVPVNLRCLEQLRLGRRLRHSPRMTAREGGRGLLGR